MTNAKLTDAVRPLAKPADVMAYTGLSKSKVYDLIQSGEIPSIQIGRSRRVRWDDLEAFIEKCRFVAE